MEKYISGARISMAWFESMPPPFVYCRHEEKKEKRRIRIWQEKQEQ